MVVYTGTWTSFEITIAAIQVYWDFDEAAKSIWGMVESVKILENKN